MPGRWCARVEASMPGRWRGREAPMPGRNVMLESISGTYAFEVPRNWKQTLTIFWSLPAWSSELETGMSHFFGVARVEFRVEFPGSASTCPGQVRRNFRQWSTGQLEKIRRGCRLRQPQHFFCWEEFTLARARQGSDAGQARPGFYAGQLRPRSHWQKKACCSPPPTGGTGIFSWEESRPWRGLRCRAGGAAGEASMFAETVGLDDSFDIFFLERIPTLARAWQGSDAGQVARQGGAPEVPRTCSSDMYSDMLKLSACSKEPGESGGSAAWRGFNAGQVARPGRLLCQAGGAAGM